VVQAQTRSGYCSPRLGLSCRHHALNRRCSENALGEKGNPRKGQRDIHIDKRKSVLKTLS
jgi:hypothetical protein